MKKYSNYKTIKEDIEKGVQVFWRNEHTSVYRTRSNSYYVKVKTSINTEQTRSLQSFISTYGYSGFYSNE